MFYFRVVPYAEIDKKNYLTISMFGVTHYTHEMVFTKLAAWEREYTIFVKLTDVPVFISVDFCIYFRRFCRMH